MGSESLTHSYYQHQQYPVARSSLVVIIALMSHKMSQMFSLVFVVFASLVGTEGNSDICHGELKIPDRSQHDHLFTANKTNLELELTVFKLDLISVTGDCCFSIYSEPEGAGSSQTFQSEGDHRLQIEVVNSVYVVECTSPLIHPVGKFILIALLTILGLVIVGHIGKKYLFRKRI